VCICFLRLKLPQLEGDKMSEKELYFLRGFCLILYEYSLGDEEGNKRKAQKPGGVISKAGDNF